MLRIFSILLFSCWLNHAWAGDDEAAPEKEYVGYVELKPFITNFGEPGTTHFLKCEVTIQVASKAADYAVHMHTAQIRNDLVFLFNAQKMQDLEGVEGQQSLAKKGLKRVQEILIEEEGEAMVSDLFFTSFVTQ